MPLQSLSDEKLQTRLARLARHERKVMALVLQHIAEVMRRKLYLTLGYPSIYHYLTKSLRYSESCAYRRIQAAQALCEVPEIKPALEQGALNRTQVCLVQRTLRKEEKFQRAEITVERRREIFAKLNGKTSRESEKILDGEVSVALPQQLSVERHRRDDSVELTLRVSPELYAKLQKVKGLYSHIAPGADWVRILALMADDVIKKRDPLAKKPGDLKPATQGFATTPKLSAIENSTAGKKSSMNKRRPIPAAVKRYILQRDGEQCQYVSLDGRKCESRHQLELDHIKPVRHGGGNEPQNLRILCRRHNDFRHWLALR